LAVVFFFSLFRKRGKMWVDNTFVYNLVEISWPNSLRHTLVVVVSAVFLLWEWWERSESGIDFIAQLLCLWVIAIGQFLVYDLCRDFY